MEQEHPIPQQISSYQFRLVGDMTLKQFFQVAGGALVALVFYSLGIPSYVKWPLIIFSFLFGVAMAFFPIEDRPLETWILAFIKTIYSPTFYIWKRAETRPVYFQEEPAALPGGPQSTEAQPTPATVANLQGPLGALEKGEEEFLSKVSEHFKAPPPPPKVTTTPTRGRVILPQIEPTRVEKTDRMATVTTKPQEPESFVSTYISPSVGQKVKGSLSAKFSSDAAPPIPPSKPNVIVGQVVDPQGKIVENAILEIKDEDGRSVRALKSNKLGHFMIVTPLANGKYQIITEKEGFVFDPVTITAAGKVLLPIAVWAKKTK
jgi:hypothetical protein